MNISQPNISQSNIFVESWNRREAYADSTGYISAWNQADVAQRIIDLEARRAKKRSQNKTPSQNRELGQKPSRDGFDREADLAHQRHQLAEAERQMNDLRAKYADRPQVSQQVPLAGLGAGLVAAREKAGLSQADLACRLHASIAEVQHWETCSYADLPLARFAAVLNALGLNPEATVHFWNGTPDFKEWPPLT